MTLALFGLPLARLARSPRGWISVALWILLALGSAQLARAAHSGVYRALGGAYGGLALPLVVFGVTGVVLGGRGLPEAVRPLVGFGARARDAALATLTTAAAASALAGGLVGALVCAIGHGPSDPPLAWDMLQSAGITALGGAAYAALFAFGSTFARGAGRGVVLGIDFLMGGSGTGALLLPRGHVRSLLGGDAVLELSGRVSTGALVVIALAFAGLAVLRSRRVP